MSLLQSDEVQGYIKPFEDEVIFRLYDLYHGDIRSIMSALNSILLQYSTPGGTALSIDEAL
ncbi:MAG: hypothetical protein HYV32_01400 [Candidatus Kerfeldbacteria bacterium]|nr:hypothetical protein [Candidatus Kerfeldbacteria bacterium]